MDLENRESYITVSGKNKPTSLGNKRNRRRVQFTRAKTQGLATLTLLEVAEKYPHHYTCTEDLRYDKHCRHPG